MTAIAVVAGAAVAMEPVAALAHRLVMHGRGWAWHRSHHQPPTGRFERNDRFPLVFAGTTIAAMAAGTRIDALGPLLPVGAGVTAYGVAYVIVHDLLVHERLGPLPGRRTRYVRWVARWHHLHHAGGGAPYGFLVPVGRAGRATDDFRAATGADVLRRGARHPTTVRSFSAVGTRARVEKTS